MKNPPLILTGIKDVLTKTYPKPKAAFLDLWGVIHDGHSLYPSAIDALKELKNAGVAVVFVSNTSQRSEFAQHKLDSLGVPHNLYKGVVTAGEAAFQHLSEIHDEQKYYYIGPKQNNLLDGVNNFRQVSDPKEAEFVLSSAFTTEKPTLKEVEPDLISCAQHKLPMICLNPDEVTVTRAGDFVNQGGQIGLRYQQMEGAGEVSFFGKPYPEVYEMALKIAGVPRNRVVSVGDSPAHDIIGGNANGFTTVLVSHTGIMQHAINTQSSPADISASCLEHCGLNDPESLRLAQHPADILPNRLPGMKSDPVPAMVIPEFAIGSPEKQAGAVAASGNRNTTGR